MTDHPITPPPELVEEWIEIAKPEPWKRSPDPNVLCTLAAQWGSDQELEACLQWLSHKNQNRPDWGINLKDARRPKPPSLKDQALADLAAAYNDDKIDDTTYETIRRALDQLDD